MPVDKYRNVGPDDSTCYRVYVKNETNQPEEGLKKDRKDGRKLNELRKIYMKTGTVSSIKGSSYIEVGNTKVLVTVYEPREIPNLAEFCVKGELQVEFRFAPFSGPSRRPPTVQSDEKDLAIMLKRALEPAVCRSEFPNCQVDIYVMVLDNDGGCFAAAVTAAGVAVADAGIPMYDTVAAAALGIYNDLTLMDPTLEEEEFCSSTHLKKTEQNGLVTLAYLPSIGQISTFSQTGALTQQRILDSLDPLIEKCCNIADLSKQRLVEDVLKKCKEEESETNVETTVKTT